MSRRFPNLTNNNSNFPNVGNVDVYKFDNDFDYMRYDYSQMELMICSVPWDMGEAHIGNRTISGIGNVVYFETKEKRDAWFDAIPDDECYRFETKFKELHREHIIDVPIPYDMCARHNYLCVRYSMFANDDSPVMFEGDDGLREWFWFIREVEFVAPNTTRLHLLEDAFQTWIYDVDITGMILERGHAPMFETRVGKYLSNPLENNTYLLTEDVNFGEISQVKHVEALGLNSGDMYACIATTANPKGSWGTKANDTWNVPANAHYDVNGVPSVYVFAIEADMLDSFLDNVNSSVPQFKQTVQGVFFASKDLITLGTGFTFANTVCYPVGSNRKFFDLIKLDASMFNYEKRYAEIAKLYTSPYAHVEITDENGNVDIVRVEDTSGTLKASAALSLAYPFITIDANVLGVGGDAGVSVTFKNLDSRTFDVTGRWYDTVRSWNVPVFAVVLDSATEYDYSTHFDREQRVIDYTTAYDNSSASATKEKANADASATREKTNLDASASNVKTNNDALADANKANAYTMAAADNDNAYDSADMTNDNAYTLAGAAKSNSYAAAQCVVDNAAETTDANTLTATRSNLSAEDGRDNAIAYNTDMAYQDNLLIRASSVSTILAQDMQGSISASSNFAQSAISGVASLAGNAATAPATIINGAIGSQATLASTHVSTGLTASQGVIEEASNTAHKNISNDKSTADCTNETTTRSDITTYQNTLTTNTAANSAAMTEANADRTYNADTTAADLTETTQKSNADRTETAIQTSADNTQTTEKANNTRSYNTSTANNQRLYDTTTANNTRSYDTSIANAGRSKQQAIDAIANDVSQAALRTPYVFGTFANGETSTTKPIALFANVVTQSKSAISSAGDEFLRYGYMLDKQWDFDGNWNIGKYFTYWKLRDFWVSNLNVPDMYLDRLRFFLFGGVTIWRRPEDIGKRSIYENF